MPMPAQRAFSGFAEGRGTTIRLPDAIFTDLLPLIDDLLELKVTLLVLRRLAQMQGNTAPWVTAEDLLTDPAIQAVCNEDLQSQLTAALLHAVERGSLLTATWERGDGQIERRYFANSPRGRAAVAALRKGHPAARAELTERPNIFTLYEQNIGSLTPLLSEELKEAETTYPAPWIEDAFREAVRLNRRSWKYIHTILKRWQAEGKDNHEIHPGHNESDRRKYIEGEYSDLIQH